MTAILHSPETIETPLEFEIVLPEIAPAVKTLTKEVFHSPEIQSLRSLTENNPWHDHENVLEHVQKVFWNLQELLTLRFVANVDLREKYRQYLDQKADQNGQYTRRELLLIACSLHDVGKGLTRPADDTLAPGNTFLITLPDGNTRGTGHEHASALVVPGFLKTSDLTAREREIVQYLVDNHDYFNIKFRTEKLSTTSENRQPETDAQLIREVLPDFNLELALHIIADEWGAPVAQESLDYVLNDVIGRYSVL